MKTPEWWAEYKCPKCGYVSYVTNICRPCELWMCATGYECKGDERRPMTKDSETYNNAIFASNAFKTTLMIGDHNIPVPEWAWFGVESIDETKKRIT